MIRLFVFCVVAAMVMQACNNKVNCNDVTYSGVIAPIVQNNCLGSGCHGNGSGNGDFTQYSVLKTMADNGKLNNRVLDKKDMPPNRLSKTDRNKIKCWLDAGAPNN